MKTNIKVIATSLSLATTVGAVAGMSGLSVQSHLGQPFSGSIVVSGDEARALIANGSVNVSGGMRASMIKQGEDRVLVRLRSSSPVHEPVMTFTVSAGRQTREYTAFIDPARYVPREAPAREHYHNDERSEETVRSTRKQRQQQAQQQDFVERKQAVAEQRRPAANSVSEKVQENEMVAVKKAAKVAVSPRRHRAHAGESLANIVERYRPHNMSQQTAMRALMLANPSAFKHGTTIRRNITLYIPTESQWHAYAQRAQKQVMRDRAARPAQTPVTRGNDAPPAPPVIPDTPAQPKVEQPKKVEPKVEPKPAEPKADVAQSKTPASDVKNVQAAKSSEPKQPVTPVVSASPVVEKSSSQVAKPNEPASQPVVPSVSSGEASAATQPRPPVPRPAQPPVVEEQPVEEETDFLQLGLMGLGAAAVVGGGAYALMRRRKNGGSGKSAVVAGDDEWETEDTSKIDEEDAWGGDIDFGAAASKPNSSSNTFNQATTIDDEPYFGDEEFSLDKFDGGNSASSSVTKEKDEFRLDDFETEKLDSNQFDSFDSFETESISKPTATHKNEDLSWLEGGSTQQNNTSDEGFVVADEDDWSLDKLDSISNNPQTKAAEKTFSLDDFVVDDVAPVVATTAAVATVAASTFVEDKADDVFDLSDFDAPASFDSAPIVETVVAETVEEKDDFAFNLDDFAAPVVNTPVAETAPVADDSAFADFDDFVVDEVVETAPAAPMDNAFADLGDFDLPVAETPVASSALNNDAAFNLDSLDDFVVDMPVSTPVALPETEFDSLNSLADLDTFDLPAAEPVLDTAPSAPVLNENAAFNLDSLDDFVVDTPVSTPVALPETEFDSLNSLADLETFDDLPVAEETVFDTAPTTPVFDDNAAFALDSLDDFVVDTPVETPAALTETEFDSLNDLADLAAFEDLPIAEETVFETVSTASAIDDNAAFALDSLDDFVVDTSVETSVETSVALSESQFDDLLDLSATSETPAVVENASVLGDDLAFGLDAFDDVTLPVAETEMVATAHSQFDEVSLDSFGLADEIGAVVVPDIAETPISLDAPAVAETPISLDMPQVDTSFDDLMLDVELDAAPVGLSAHSAEPVGMLDLTTGPLESSALDNVNLDTLEVLDDVHGWQEGNADAGFVSGAVSDMTEPLEAKFELAKMYLEIDDAVAARETLRELISESSGAIQQQAQQLLADLGN